MDPQTITALCAVLASLGFIFNLLLRPVKNSLQDLKQSQTELKQSQTELKQNQTELKQSQKDLSDRMSAVEKELHNISNLILAQQSSK